MTAHPPRPGQGDPAGGTSGHWSQAAQPSRLALVTGGGTGIGYATALRLAEAGDDVIIVGRRADVLANAAEQINVRIGAPRARPVAADLRDPDSVTAMAQVVAAGLRPLDIIVNNAGGNVAAQAACGLAEIKAQYLENFGANVLTAVLTTHALLPHVRAGGRIIVVGSIAAVRGNASYGAAKAALHPWASELAGRLAASGITVNVIAPGYVGDTDFYQDRMTPAFHAARSAQAPVRRGAAAAEIAALIAYVASAEAGFLTGEIIHINGGALLARR